MDTPHLPLTIFGDDFNHVYEPAEDTFLLLDALEKELNYIRDHAYICLECGSGSGMVITALAKALAAKETNSRFLIATDINEHACKTTRKCAAYHKQENIQVLRANLATCLSDRLKNQVDLILFNPPYVPTPDNETESYPDNEIQLSWAGGTKGRKLIDEFLSECIPNLLSKPHGKAYMIALQENNVPDLLNYLFTDYNIKGSVVLERKAGCELLYVIKYEWAD